MIPTAVVFDMDGVLLDSEPLWQRAEIEVFASVGVELSVAECLLTQGLRVDEVVEFWFERRPWTNESTIGLAHRLLGRVRDLVLEEAEPAAGLHSLLTRLTDRGTPIALATSSPMMLVDAVLVRFGIADAFAAVASAEHEPYGKPHPAVYLTAAAGLGIAPTACVAIEDSVNGVISAKAARMECFAVPAVDQRDDPRFGIADLVLDDLDAVATALDRRAP